MVTALILAGGVGSRVGADVPKQFVEILGKPVLAYTIEIYQENPEVDAIEVVCHEQWTDYLKEMIETWHLTKVKWIAPGGETFQDSVINGVNYLKDKIAGDDIVMIHYGASPFTNQKTLTDGIRVCRERGMSASSIPCFQLIGSNDGDSSRTWIDRDQVVQITCPQSFRYEYLLKIFRDSEEKGLLETIEPHTTSLMYALGEPIYLSYGDQTNVKITTKEDLDLFEGYVLMKQRKKNQ